MDEMLANVLGYHQAGELSKAGRLYQSILVTDPSHDNALHFYGVLSFQSGSLAAGTVLIYRAIRISPNSPQYYFNLGNGLREFGQINDAIQIYRQCLAIDQFNAENHMSLGVALQDNAKLSEAFTEFLKAAVIEPDIARAWYNMAVALHKKDELTQAIISYHRAIRIRHDYSEAFSNWGNALQELGQQEESLEFYRMALIHAPNSVDIFVNQAAALHEIFYYDQAIKLCCRALTANKYSALAYNSLGVSLHACGRLDESEDSYRKAMIIDPNYAEAKTNLGMVQLAQGKMQVAWRSYEWRWRSELLPMSRRRLNGPQWRGEAGHGRTLLIHAEQGLGDSLQFCRFAPIAAAMGWRVVLEVQAPLVRLLRRLAAIDHVIAQGEELPAFDAHCPMLSLPLAIENIPTNPYLRPEAIEVAKWRQYLETSYGKSPRIGLVWAGNQHTNIPRLSARYRRRSLSPILLKPLFDRNDIKFFSLQKEKMDIPDDFPLIDLMDEVNDFADTAALIANLDLILTIDTAAAHLAGAMGKKTWLMNLYDTCWRWRPGKKRNPWYPSIRIFRQTSPGDWEGVLARMSVALAVHDFGGNV